MKQRTSEPRGDASSERSKTQEVTRTTSSRGGAVCLPASIIPRTCPANGVELKPGRPFVISIQTSKVLKIKLLLTVRRRRAPKRGGTCAERHLAGQGVMTICTKSATARSAGAAVIVTENLSSRFWGECDLSIWMLVGIAFRDRGGQQLNRGTHQLRLDVAGWGDLPVGVDIEPQQKPDDQETSHRDERQGIASGKPRSATGNQRATTMEALG